ncbi:hypothetical protein NQZ68_024676 [Dissostichus eleginoides]|nr:hypothetical protein NQZ68_024676 [Dissostichus eleginoides]
MRKIGSQTHCCSSLHSLTHLNSTAGIMKHPIIYPGGNRFLRDGGQRSGEEGLLRCAAPSSFSPLTASHLHLPISPLVPRKDGCVFPRSV